MTTRTSLLLGMIPLGACLARVTGFGSLRPICSLRFSVVGSVAFSPRPTEEKSSP